MEVVTILSGLVFKKGGKRNWLGQSCWKLRNAVLTSTHLSCYTAKGGKLKGQMDLSNCSLKDIEIMPKDCLKKGYSKASIWRIAIRAANQRYILATRSEVDMNAWIYALETAIMSNKKCFKPSDIRRSFLKESVARCSQRESFRVYRISSREFSLTSFDSDTESLLMAAALELEALTS